MIRKLFFVLLIFFLITYNTAQASTVENDYQWLIDNLGILDKAELTDAQIKEIAVLAEKARKTTNLVNRNNDIYRKYLLWPRVFDEPSEHYRPFFNNIKPKEVKSVAQKLRWTLELTNSLKPREWQYLGGMAGPLTIYQGQVATKAEMIMYTIAILRSLGIPARAVRAVNLPAYDVEYYNGKTWVNLQPQRINKYLNSIGDQAIAVINQDGKSWADATQRYIKNAVRVNLSLNMGTTRSQSTAWENWMISYPLKDELIPLDYFMEYCVKPLEDGSVEFYIRPGTYYVSWALRNSQGQAQMQIRTINVIAGQPNSFDFDILDGLSFLSNKDLIQIAQPAFDKVNIEIIKGQISLQNLIDNLNKPLVILIIDKELEPSRRAIDQIYSLFQQNATWNWAIIYVNETNQTEFDKLATLNKENLFVYKISSIDLPKISESFSELKDSAYFNQLPLIWVLSANKTVLGSWKGYGTDLAVKIRYVLMKNN